jgi:hypothetical protein
VVSAEVTRAAPREASLEDGGAADDVDAYQHGHRAAVDRPRADAQLVIHPPLACSRTVTAQVYRVDTAQRLRVHMSGVSVSGREGLFASCFADASEPWMLEVMEAEREVGARLRNLAVLHGLPLGEEGESGLRIFPTVRKVNAFGFFSLLNNPDEGAHDDYALGCTCDFVVELLETRKSSRSSRCYSLVWRVVSAKVTRADEEDELEYDRRGGLWLSERAASTRPTHATTPTEPQFRAHQRGHNVR